MKTYIKNIRAFWKIYKDTSGGQKRGIGARDWSFGRYIVWYTWNLVIHELKKKYKINTNSNR